MAPVGAEKVNEEFYNKAKEEALKYFRSKHEKEITEDDIKKKHALRPRNAADQLTEKNIKKFYFLTYGILYSPASSVGHGEAPLNFVYFDNNKLNLKKWSKGNSTEMCLKPAILFTLYGVEYLSNLLKIDSNLDVSLLRDKFFSIMSIGAQKVPMKM